MWRRETKPRKENVSARREIWRKLHRYSGLIIAIPLVFFVLSGLAWTNIWGGKIVQPWGSLPGTRFELAEQHHTDNTTHKGMNQEGVHQVAWSLEQTPLEQAPLPHTNYSQKTNLNLDDVVAIARAEGLNTFRVHVTHANKNVWTISASTIAGDIDNPVHERTLHIHPTTGDVLAEYRFADYPALGKAMSTFIPLHQGDLGWWNYLLNVFFCAFVIFLTLSGITLWWKRRPAKNPNNTRTATFAPPAQPRFSTFAAIVLLVIALCFPLSALAMIILFLFDWVTVLKQRSNSA